MKKSLLYLAFFLASHAAVHAQVTTSSIAGLVTQSEGISTAGATIKAVHGPSGTVYSGSANVAGRFNLTNMRIGGPYRVEVTYVGQDPLTYENIFLELGQTFVLNPVFDGAFKTLDEVTVTGYQLGRITEKTGASTNLGLRQIQELPQANRSINEFLRLTPQANGSSFAGRDDRYNNLQIDGANFNNGFGTSSGLLPGGVFQPISLDAIEEISVNIAPYDVTQSGFTGAGINAVTKSGTNQFQGSAYGYFNNQYLNGLKAKDNQIEYVEAAKKYVGFSLGGPIIKDKLFFFLSAEQEQASGANATGSNLWRSSENGVSNASQNITRVKTSDLDAVKSHLQNRWGYDAGAYEGYADEAQQKGTKFLARFDWNINEQHKFALRYNQLVGTSNQLANNSSGPAPRSNYNRVSENSIAFQNANYSFENTVRSITAELNSNFNSQLSNKFLATYSRIQDKRIPNGSIFPFVDIWDGNIGDIGPVGSNNYMSFGTELFSYKNNVLNDNISITNNLTYTLGKHTFTGGLAFEFQKFENSFLRMGTSHYRYGSVADFLTTGTPNEVAPISFGLTYPYDGEDGIARVNFGLGSLYAQDRINLSDRFNVTLGLRAELPMYFNKLKANTAIDNLQLLDNKGNKRTYASGEWPNAKIMLSPRIGFNYDVIGDRSLIVRGGTGVFAGRVPFVWLTNMPANSGVLQNVLEPGNYESIAGWIGNVRFSPDMHHHLNNPPIGADSVFIRKAQDGLPKTFSLVDRNFKMPTIWRTSLGADYQIPNSPITLTADILYTRDINAVQQFGANRKSSGLFMDNAGDNREYYPNGQSYTYNSAMGGNSVVVLTNTDKKGYSFSATFGASVSNWHNLSGSLFYTYSAAKEVTPNAGSNAISAWQGTPIINNPNDNMLHISDYAIPHRVVASLSYRIANSTIGIYYNGSHQGRFSYTYNGDLNGDRQAIDLIHIPRNSNDLNFETYSLNYRDQTGESKSREFTVEDQVKAFDAFIAENALEKYRGTYLPRNKFLMPWLNRVDVRWTQDLFKNIAIKGDKFQLTADIVNLGNLINSNWGVRKTILSNGRSMLRPNGWVNEETGEPLFRMLTDNNPDTNEPFLVTTPFRDASTIATTWSAMLGVRYAF